MKLLTDSPTIAQAELFRRWSTTTCITPWECAMLAFGLDPEHPPELGKPEHRALCELWQELEGQVPDGVLGLSWEDWREVWKENRPAWLQPGTWGTPLRGTTLEERIREVVALKKLDPMGRNTCGIVARELGVTYQTVRNHLRGRKTKQE